MQHKAAYKQPAKPSVMMEETRSKRPAGEGANSQGWAISYADLLMVLLCLFIGLSVVDDSDRTGDNLLREISVSFKKGESVAGKTVTGDAGGNLTVDAKEGMKGGASKEAKNLEATIYESLSFTLEKIGVRSELVQERNEILLKFETNLYEKGAINLNDESKAKLEEVLVSLDAYKGKIDLSVVGHTDRTPVRQMRTTAIQENIDLAVLRASNATKWIRDRGFPAEDLRIEVSDPQADDRRSLSLHVRVKPHLDSKANTEKGGN